MVSQVLTAPSLSVLCRYGQHGYGTKEKDSPSEDQSVLTTLYLRFDSHYNEPGANHSSSIHLQSVLTTLYLCVDCRYDELGANHSSQVFTFSQS